MTLELPILRLGLAGFSAEQEQAVSMGLHNAAVSAAVWELSDLSAADVWWVNGARTQVLDDHRILVAEAGLPTRSLELHMASVHRPVAFARPLPSGLEATYTFDLASQAGINSILEKLEAWLAPVSAQFCLAAHIVEHQSALRSGFYDVSLSGTLLAVVDMRGEAAVLPSAGPADFEHAVWGARTGTGGIPEHFARASLSQLMWQYAVRTARDLLPRHYRTRLLYFRRPPRLAQRLLTDSHLLLMRELLTGPATFSELRARCGFHEGRLACDLAALYFVGSITSNAKRAARWKRPEEAESMSGPQSNLDSVPPAEAVRRTRTRVVPSDLTVPAPLALR